jgi:parallel beta-helix repeat protein
LLGLNLGIFETDYQIGTELVLSDNLGEDQKVLRLSSQSSEECFLNKIVSKPRLSTLKVISTQSYIKRGPISISSNTNLKLNFPGNGTIDDPVRIEGFNITASGVQLISISDTTLYFRIANNILKGQVTTGGIGIHLDNVIHGTIFNNTIYDNEYAGIELGSSDDNTITNNTIYGSDILGMGIYLSYGENNIISNNTIYNCTNASIVSHDSDNTTISYNLVFDPIGFGAAIILGRSPNSTISSNTIHNHVQALAIESTTHSHIVNNVIHDSQSGIDLFTSSNYNRIAQNVIYNCEIGITLESSTHNIIVNNTIYSCYVGITIHNSSNYNRVAQNVIYDCEIGITFDFSIYNTISGNNISYAAEDGIGLGFSDHNIIFNNLVFDNDGNGINLWDSSNNIISNNTVFNNSNEGIVLSNSHYLMITNNTINDNPRGIMLWDCNNNIISRNKVYNNLFLGISLWHDLSPSHNNTVTRNDLSGNNPGRSQASDKGTNNVFSYNYWSEWTSPDANGDGVVDKPYVIVGSAYNQDQFSLVSSPSIHYLLLPIISTPIGGELLSDDVVIYWNTAVDTWGHNVNYNVYYSPDEGTTWIPLATSITSTSYTWDTTIVTSGTDYMLKVNATCTEELPIEYTSDIFELHNDEISTPTILSPKSGETLNGTVTIEWNASLDLVGHSIIYTVYFSSDEGATWTQLTSDLTSTSYSWDTTTIPDGLSYLIKVVTTCSEGEITEDISDGTFSIQNTIPTKPETLVTPGMTALMFLFAVMSLITIRKGKKR